MDFNLTAEEVRQLFDAVHARDISVLQKQNSWLREEVAKQEAALKYRYRIPDAET